MGSLKIRTLGAGELTQQLGAFIALAENLGSVPSTHMMAHDKNWVLIGRSWGGRCFLGCLLRKLLGGPGEITQLPLFAEEEVQGSGQPERGLTFQPL